MERNAIRRFVVVPVDFSPDNLPQDKLEELHINGPHEQNADIVKMENGVVKRPRLLYRRRMADRLGAKLPPVESEIVKRKGTEKKVFGKEGEDKDLKKGVPPLPQLVMYECGWEDGLKFGEIVDIITSLKWFKSFDFNVEKNLEDCLEYYKYGEGEEAGFVTFNKDDNTWHYGPKLLKDHKDLGEEGYNIEEGPYPVVGLIRDFVSSEGRAREEDIIREVFNKWRWTSSRSTAKDWLERTKKERYVREVEDGLFEPHRPI